MTHALTSTSFSVLIDDTNNTETGAQDMIHELYTDGEDSGVQVEFLNVDDFEFTFVVTGANHSVRAWLMSYFAIDAELAAQHMRHFDMTVGA